MKKSPLSLLRTRWAAYVHDLLWVPIALTLAYWVRFNFESLPASMFDGYWLTLSIALVVQSAIFFAFGLYRGMWRFASIPDLMRILQAVLVGTVVIFACLFLLNRLHGVPRTVILLYPVFLVAGLTGPRLMYRWFKDHGLMSIRSSGKRALLIGAGRAGEMLVRDLIKDAAYQPLGFLDDDPAKFGREVHGVRVIGVLSELEQCIGENAVEIVLIAMPTAPASVMRRIVNTCVESGVPCVTLPSISELADGRVEVSRLREVSIEDLLGRAAIQLNDDGVIGFIGGKRVLVTGAGGSIGSELCRQVYGYGPQKLVMLDHGEFNLYQIEQEMRAHCSGERCVALLGDVRDEAAMRRIFEQHHPEIVLHAAAYKHVPLVEDNPVEGVKTNVFGTRVIADLALEFGVEKFVLVSTDKAVNPTNVMGASKRAAEIYCQANAGVGRTAFITTRFGNVLGSAGSVVPLFRRQIAAGGPVTVTHPDITRYFMTIPEAVSLILQAAAMGTGGEIFVLDMGEPVRIVDLAEQMIRLSGHEPGRDIEIRFIGLRPGEKLYEELFHKQESLMGTQHPKILLAEARVIDRGMLQKHLQHLLAACNSFDADLLRHLVKEIVPEFSGLTSLQVHQSDVPQKTDSLH